MGVDKQGSKGVGGFFQLFDWNGKSRKKLFANKSDLPDGLKQGKKHDENLPTTRFRLTEDDEIGGSTAKGGSDYSCASSVTDDDASGIRAPSVVARLMGLESLPTSSVSEPHVNLLYESRALRDSQYQRKTHEFLNDYRTMCTANQPFQIEGFSREIMEPKPQKIQSRLIERFQSEPLPPKSAKSVPLTYHKLLSPIKSPGFISPKSAAHIMEAAAKILEPGLQVGSKGKLPALGSSSVPIKFRDLKENASASQRQLKLPEASKRLNESNAVKMLKGQSLNKSWNGSEETPVFRASDMDDTHSVGSKSKGKSVSLAVQAKVNVQRREGLSSGTKGPLSSSSSSRKEEDDFRSKQPAKNTQITSKNKQNKASGSGVLRQNNIKQNCATNREKVPHKPSASNQQGRKVPSGDSSAGRSKTLNKVPMNGRGGGYRKDGSKITESEKELPSSKTKNLPRKKRALEVDFHGEKGGFVGTNVVDRDQKTGQSRVTINEHTSCSDDSGRRGMDVVSFTFTSPMVKTMSGSQSSAQMAEKRENLCYVGSQGDKNESNLRNKKQSSLGLNVIGGDALSVLLEQKLRELTSGLESSCSNTMKTGSATASASILQDLISALNSVSATPGHSEKETLLPQNDQLIRDSNSSCFSTDSQVTMPNLKLQGVGQMTECSSSSDIHKEFDYQHPSPVSILEASFSCESCNSSESCESISGCKQDSSTVAHCNGGMHCPEKTAVMEAEADLSDSASSAYSEGIDREQLTGAGLEVGHIMTEKQEMEYVREIISHAEIMLKDASCSDTHEIVDSPLFEKLEKDKYGTRRDTEEDKEAELRRKSLFDCVRECLNLKHRQYLQGGHREWAQGTVMLRSKKLAEDVYKEIGGWRCMADWMVDELVDKDMSTGLGRWTHYEAEGFEVGIEIEKRIFSSLINEVVAGLRS